MVLLWRTSGEDPNTGLEIGRYILRIPDGDFPLVDSPEAAAYFAQSMQGGIRALSENFLEIFGEDSGLVPGDLEWVFNSADTLSMGGELVFEAAAVEAESLLECMEEAALALLEFLL
jgi:hypothetical protein